MCNIELDYSTAIQTKGLKSRVHHDAERIDETFRVGVEIEGCLLDKMEYQLMQNY
jgi:hypothetical protein